MFFQTLATASTAKVRTGWPYSFNGLAKAYACVDRPGYLTIIPRARMGSESIAHELRPKAEWAIDSEALTAKGITVLVKSN